MRHNPLKLAFVILVPLAFSAMSCRRNSIGPPDIPKEPDRGTYITSTTQGLVYWRNGKDTLIVQGSFLLNPRFSPDKRWIVYAHPNGSGYTVNIVRTTGDSLRSLASGQVFRSPYYPAWSPDGTKIAFVDTNAVVVVTLSSGTVQNFSANNQQLAHEVCPWSRDGLKIAFVAWSSYVPLVATVYSVNVESGALDTLAEMPTNIRWLTWSADGQRIAFYAYTNDLGPYDWNIFIYSLLSRQISRVSNAIGEDLYPAWSPTDTNLLAYSGGSDSLAVPRILVLYDLSSNIRRPLSTANESPSDFPIWSADGQKILFRGGNSYFYYVTVTSGEIVPLNITGVSIDW